MTIQHVAKKAGRRCTLGALFSLVTAPAFAMNILVAGVNITDLAGDVHDTDGAANGTITFNSGAAGPAGFAIAGYTVTGKVKVGGGGAIAGAGMASIVSLTEFTATRVAAVGAVAPLVITFTESFAVPANPKNAVDHIKGSTTHKGAVNVEWQGSVNGVAIKLPMGPNVFAFAGPAGGVNVDVLNNGHGLMAIPPPAGPPWVLKGDLKIDLGAVGDVLTLPTSAEVGILAIPEPPSLALLAGGLLFMGVAGLRRRQK